MIGGIRQIGKEILRTLTSDEELIENLVLDVPEEIKKKKQHIVILKLQTSPPSLYVDFKEIQDNTSTEYLWLGNPPAANLPQDRFTTNHLEYLVSQTVPNLIEKLPDSELKNSLSNLKKEIYFDLGTRGGGERRYRYIWDVSKFDFGFTDKMKETLSKKKLLDEKVIDKITDWRSLYEEFKKESAEKVIGFIKDLLFEYVKEKTNLTIKEIVLFTLNVDDILLTQHSDYKQYIFETLIDETFIRTKDGVCHLCGETKKITSDTTKFKFKFYMTDKIGFSSGLGGDKTFAKNYALCQECYKAIIAAEPFIQNKLKSWLAGSNVYIIPSFHLETPIPIKKLDKWAEYLTNSFNATRSLEEWHRFQEKLEEYREYEIQKDNVSLNFLFWEKRQAEFKILQLMQDVPPSRLDKLRQTAFEVQRIGNRLLGESPLWYLSLRKLFYLFPVRKTRKDVCNKKVLEFYNNLFSNIPISYSFLIKEFVELTGVYYFEKFPAYTISSQNPDIDMCNALLSCNLLLRFLKKSNLLKGGDFMDQSLEELQLSTVTAEFIKEMDYSEPKTALFLLGKLIGEIGTEQYRQGAKKKPILNKLNFQTMRLQKIAMLTNDIFEKMKQYKVLSSETEKTYGIAKMLLDKHSSNWPLTARENVFYILSGYAFATHKAITSKESKIQASEKPEEKIEQEEVSS